MEMTSDQILNAIHDALAEVDRKLASGELNGSGRFFTDEELVAGAATGLLKKNEDSKKGKSAAAPAA